MGTILRKIKTQGCALRRENNQKPQGELRLRLDDQRNESDRRYDLPGGGALSRQLGNEKMVVIFFVPPFLILEQFYYSIGSDNLCQDLLIIHLLSKTKLFDIEQRLGLRVGITSEKIRGILHADRRSSKALPVITRHCSYGDRILSMC